jgi:hypothetical protein
MQIVKRFKYEREKREKTNLFSVVIIITKLIAFNSH